MQCNTFGIVSQLLISWEQGYLGLVLSFISLLVGAGFALKTQNLYFLPFSIGLAIILFFFPDVVQGITGIPSDACVQQLQQERQLSSDLSQCSAQIPSYSGQGRSCFCAAMDPTPSCSSSSTTPLPSPGPGATGHPILYHSGDFSGGPESWTYIEDGTQVTYTLYAEGSCEIETMDGQIENEYCD